MKKFDRMIHFYDIFLDKFDGTSSFIKSQDYKSDLCDMFEKCKGLPFDKNNLDYSRCLKKINNTYDFIEVDEITEKCIKGRLINIDDSGLTYYEEHGELKLLKETLPEYASVAEVSHFVIFFDFKIMAFEYNPKCSHASSLSSYLRTKFSKEYFIEFKNLINRNKQKMFDSIVYVKKFEFNVSSKLLKCNKANKEGFFEAADAALALTNNETDVEQNITIKVSPKRITKKNKKPYYSAEKLKKSIANLDTSFENPEDYYKLNIVGINELNEQIAVNYTNAIVTKRIYFNPNEIEKESFFEKMEEAYRKVIKKYI